jgi:hypothetical protein
MFYLAITIYPQSTVFSECSHDVSYLELSSDEEKLVIVEDPISLLPEMMLTCDHITQALSVLQLQFSNIGGLVDTLLFQSLKKRNLNLKESNVYILHTPNNKHWVTITNINCHQKSHWMLFDSLNNIKYLECLNKSFKKIAEAQNQTDKLEICLVNVQGQNGIYDCGLFAIAYAFEICNNKNPAKIEFHQELMRDHYNNCIKKNMFESFPQKPRNNETVYQLHTISF